MMVKRQDLPKIVSVLIIAFFLISLSISETKRTTIPDGYVDIKAYGARGDGFTDDAPAIQKAENAGISIFFPKGVYRIGSNIIKRTKVNWLGAGYDSILLINGSPSSYSSSDIIRNESYGIEDTAFNHSYEMESCDYAYRSIGKFDSFEIKNLAIRVRSPLKPGEPPNGGYIHIFSFMHTRDVNISNVYMDSISSNNRGNCIFVFKGGNYNTTINNCKMIHNTDPSVAYGGSIIFASRSTSDPIQYVTISNNKIIKKNGGDEILWLAANFNSINEVIIRNNTIDAGSNIVKASVIMLAQDSDRMLQNVSEPFHDVKVYYNVIHASNLNFSNIFIGYDFGHNPRKSGTINIYNNYVQTFKNAATDQVVSGILVGRAKKVNIQNNTIIGNQDMGITAKTDVEKVKCKENNITFK